ncbi:non-ribosomal peptide synthetase [Hyalangium gracile]|uniref:non-ribosomal peptide synthetase n=1 Tax=Hyalangium gracile TaxID=394092 RepID=UPI001CCD9B17|nr:non-ribosomal peptide synthase/polyketide synthase [Hyalangium gracile]
MSRDDQSPGALSVEEKRALLRKALSERSEKARTAPLSFGQQRLWLLDTLEPGGSAYNIPAALRLVGALDVSALERSLREVLRRHEVLRSRIVTVEEQPQQQVVPSGPFSLTVTDLGGMEPEARAAEVRRRAEAEARRPFELGQAPMLRAEVLRLGPSEHVLLLTLHHIAADAWSTDVLLRELGVLYPAFKAGLSSPLPDLPIQYADFTRWQRERLRGERLERLVAHWRERVGAQPTLLQLPTDRPRSARPGFEGALHTFRVPAPLAEALRSLSRQQNVTLFMTLLSAFNVLLHRYTDAERVLVGSPIAGRTRLETEQLIGFFVNMLALSTDVSGNPSFLELLARVRSVTVDAYEHQELPFEQLVEAVQPERREGGNPLFEVVFHMDTPPLAGRRLGDLEISLLEFERGSAKFDVTLSMMDTGSELVGTIEYRTGLFDAATISRMAGHYVTVLEAVAARPELRIESIPLLSAAERRQLLDGWNDTATDVPLEPCVVSMFEAQAAQVPQALAVTDGARSLTYEALNRQANQLAHHLRALGVGPDVPVGLHLERSIEQLVGLLAILKAGGAYVPLDPSHPKGRLAHILSETGMPVVLSRRSLAEQLPELPVQVLCIDAMPAELGSRPEHNLEARAGADNLAYILYTSGSTGRPKGVMIPHRGLTNYLRWGLGYYGAEGQGAPVQSPLSFDLTVTSLLTPLLSGKRVVLCDEEASGTGLSAWLRANADFSLVKLTPAHLTLLEHELKPEDVVGAARVMVIGGEALSAEQLEFWRHHAPHTRLINEYGPTETVVGCCIHEVPAQGTLEGQVPIGRPIANTQLYVLGRAMEPVPTGVPGELYIGGAGVARGYLARPDLSAERFVPDPFSRTPGARLYRTGDLVRYQHDGTLVYLGRIDRQVKIRGFRIELEEIETVLAGAPAVRECAVITTERLESGMALVAFAAMPQPSPSTERQLLEHLKAHLPPYMVPSYLQVLEALPLTENGKVDRRALAVLARDARPTEAEGAAPPQTPTEELLAGIWAQALGHGRIGRNQSFFEIGGHSLRAVQVLSHVRKLFQVELPLRVLFETPTLAGLARRIDAEKRAQAEAPPPPVVLARRDERLPLSFAQQRLWFLDQLEPGSATYNIPAALHLRGALEAAVLERAFAEILRRHEALRTTFDHQDGEPFQRVHAELPFQLHRVDLTGLSQAERMEEAVRQGTADASRPFDLRAGPLLRATLFRLDEREHFLLVNMHHIVSDGWSIGVLMQEVSALYNGLAHGQPPKLEPLPFQYADFASWQRTWMQGQLLERQLSWWRSRLDGELPVLNLPTDRPRPSVQTYRGETLAMTLDAALVEQLRRLSQRSGATLFMTLLSAFKVLLYRYSGQEDIVVGVPVAGRTQAEFEKLIGFFVNTLPIRSDLSGAPTFQALLERIRGTTLEAYAHQDVPFEKLVEVFQPERSLSHSPLFQVVFTMDNATSATLELQGLEWRALPLENHTAKFDLTMAVAESPHSLSLSLEFNSDLFDAGTMQRLLGHYRTVLEAVATDATQSITRLPLLTPEERHQLVMEWNQTEHPLPERCAHELISEQARRTPEAIAAVSGSQSITYARLEEQAGKLAVALLQVGVAPDAMVLLLSDRGIELLSAVLGIFQAGGAYIALNPTHPVSRHLEFLQQSRSRVIVASRAYAVMAQEIARAAGAAQPSVLIIEDVLAAPRVSAPAPTRGTRLSDLAYAFFTSGSTGTPKGAMIEHRGMLNHLSAKNHDLGLKAGDAVVQNASQCFDISVWQMLCPLLVGGRTVIVDDEIASDAGALLRAVDAHGVSIFETVPSMLRAMLEVLEAQPEAERPRFQALRWLISNAEALPPELCQRWFRLYPHIPMINTYGATECSDDTNHFHILEAPQTDMPYMPLGRRLINIRLYIVDAHLNPVPLGVPGEICLAGISVGRGYLNDPERTAKAYITDPFVATPSRMYRTGDIARYHSDGQIEFLGRRDHQVKIRGYRVELGEIEATLLDAPGVNTGVVVVRGESGGAPRLVAYLVPQAGATLQPGALKEHVKARLPEYMVPSAFVILDALPLNSNGKVDRRRLPAPTSADLALSEAFEAPRTPTEELVAGIFAQVLHVERVGASDHFFELGGHSLLATQVISRVRRMFQVELPIRALFEAPTVSALAERVEVARRAETMPAVPPLRPVARDQALPLSFAQQRLWFLAQLEPGSASYNIPVAVRISGPLEPARLERSLNTVVQRHEALRTGFIVRDEVPYQRIESSLHLPLEQVDLSALAGEEREVQLQQLLTEAAARPFELTRAPLLRTVLYRLDASTHVLLMNLHHIISDGWSEGVLLEEVGASYRALSEGAELALPALPIQYADFSLWQRGYLQGEVLEAQLGYWRDQLKELSTLELPTDRPRPAMRSHRGAQLSVTLPASLTQALNELSRREGVTLFMTLLAGFQALLSRYSGQDDIAVGTPIANRNRTELEGLIGFFVNTLVLRTKLSGDPTVRTLLERVREATLGAYAHQDLPFERLVEELHPQRDLSRSPLFQVMFVLQNAAMQLPAVPGLEFGVQDLDTGTSKFDLLLSLEERPDGLAGMLEYNTDLFEEATVLRMMGQFQELLGQLAASPEAKVSRLSILPPEERQRMLVTWNQTERAVPEVESVLPLFQAQVARTPDAVAVVFDDASLTYAELERRSNQLAHALRALGVGPEVCVALSLERSLELVVSVLGILKAGGAYVPLDASYPVDRLAFMLEDSRAPVLITRAALRDRFPGYQGHLLLLDGDWPKALPQRFEPPPHQLARENLSYVLYTSGSTGRPKGVAMRHGVLVSLIPWQNEQSVRGGALTTLQFSSISFDVSFQELFSTWTSGGTLVLISEEGRRDPERMLQVIERHRVERIFMPYVALQNLAETAYRQSRRPESLTEIASAGEQLQLTPQVAWLCEGFKEGALHNQYGPTETHICTALTLSRATAEWPVKPSIGRPLANSRSYVLDAHLQPVPVGVVGELFIGGLAVARGYLHRPDLTADRFMPDPFSPMPGGRMYRTGDTARYLPNGEIEFLGRNDHQVKIRGFRIELGEIEALLGRHEAVRSCAAAVREDVAGDRRLVAYVVADREGLNARELQTFLSKQVPEYAVPSAFVFLDGLPVTPSGKVDRKRLPAPGWSDVERQSRYIAPETPIQKQLAALWAESLKVPRVGLHDSFFELGGHSLLVTQVVSRIRKAFGIDLPLRALFEAPRLDELAARIERMGAAHAVSEPALVPVARTGDLPLSYAQQRLWFLEQLAPGGASYHIPAMVRLSGRLNRHAIEQCFTLLLQRHESLRTGFEAVDGQPVQRIHPSVSFELRWEDLRALPAEVREARARAMGLAYAEQPFELTRGPLLRAAMLELAEDDHVLVLCMHHIISDGWSIGVLVRELAEIYESLNEGREPRLPALPIQYADFAVWQRRYLQGAALEAQLGYWKERLGGAPPLLELPTDRPRPAVQTHRGAQLIWNLPAELLRSLQAVSLREEATLFMTLLTGFKVLLARYSRQDDILVGTPIANRNRAEVEGLIGFFVNAVVMRTDLSGNPSFRELLGRVRETALAAYAHQDLPFERLVEVLQPERDLRWNPLFQVAFVLQNTPFEPIALPGLTCSYMEPESHTAKFDLGLAVTEGAEGLTIVAEYNVDLFDAATIQRMLGHYQRLLESLAAQPEQRILEAPLLSTAELRQLAAWNETHRPVPTELCLHQLVEQQAARTPQAVAIAWKGQVMTYQELNRQADLLAVWLQAQGVGRETRVGVLLDRSPEYVIATLAVLKAGGAYVTMDTANPRERIAYIVRESGAPIVLTREGWGEGVPPEGVRVISWSEDSSLWTSGDPSRLTPVPSSLDDLAYVIHTSGSTGQPKGVLVPHRGAISLVLWYVDQFQLTEKDRAPLLSGTAFDAIILEVWPILAVGATLCIPENEVRLQPATMAAWLREQRITFTWLPTPMAVAMLNEPGVESLELRSLVTAGDALPDVSFSPLASRVVNNYGPTEITVCATFMPLAKLPPGVSPPPIGRPIWNTTVHVLDARLQPVPVGVPGDLYIGGIGVTRGYLGRPELTAESFLPDPFSSTPGARMYRTGDIVRYLPDGLLMFMGRADRQVKLRGLRIELQEIEAVLLAQPRIQEAVVLLQERGEKHLVAYVVPQELEGFQEAAVRAELQRRLPAYMVPKFFIPLAKLPVLLSGKVDRRALLELRPVAPTNATEEEPPSTPTERKLAEIWREVLGVQQVGALDNFFLLGGHSLLGTRVIAQARSAFQVDLPIRSLFENSTLREFAAFIEALVAKRGSLQAPPLTRAPAGVTSPLSYAQQRLWFVDQMQPGNPAYNVPGAIRISGPLDPDRLLACLHKVEERHEILRTSFQLVGHEAVQVVHPPHRLVLPVEDLRTLPREAREEEVRRRARAEMLHAFELSAGPLVRVRLLRLEESEHVLLINMHHIISDGWSLGILIREVLALYEAALAGTTATLPELPIQYRDYAIWQQSWLRGEALDAQLFWWREHLGEAPPVLNLPTDRPRPSTVDQSGRTQTLALPPQLSERLHALSRQEGVTLFMTLFSTFHVLLHRYTGQEDMVVGTSIAGRTHAEMESLIGPFLNLLPLRTRFAREESFLELLQRVRQNTLGAYAHQEIPFERLVAALVKERDTSRAPLAQVLFVLLNVPMPRLELSGVKFEPLSIPGQTSQVDLTFIFDDGPEGLVGTVEYSTALFNDDTITRMLGHFQTLLEAIVETPGASLQVLPLLSAPEREQLLRSWNHAPVPQPLAGTEPISLDTPVAQLFEAQAARTPDAVAVQSGDVTLTYRQLNETANRLAHALREDYQVQPGEPVGMMLERSERALITMLAILKAGGAYVPIDPGYSSDRVKYLLDDLRLRTLLIESHSMHELPDFEGNVFAVDLQLDSLTTSEANPAPVNRPEDLAYILYTSGSTGQPKGVSVPHRAIARLVSDTNYLPVRPSDCFGQIATITFDAATFEIWSALLYGARVVVIPKEVLLSPEAFAAAIERHGITAMFMTSALFNQVAQRVPHAFRTMRTLLVGGDVVDPRWARAVLQAGAPERLLNGYGPTECTTFALWYPIHEGFSGTTVPIGRPIAHTSVYVLDPAMNPVPVGVPGELYLGGVGLAHGYWNAPELTAQKFVPNPFQDGLSERLYRTGDLVRYLPDGNVEFLGRVDHQVKIRGFRIELGEIETALRAHPALAEAAVLLRVSPEGDKRLVAYVLPRQGETVTVLQLRAFLQQTLPEYMLPATFVLLTRMPLTATGKIDRAALPVPDLARLELGEAYEAPRNDIERAIAEVWGEVLGIERVGIHDNYFALGGDSILSIRVLALLKERGLEASLMQLFAQKTVAELAAVVTAEPVSVPEQGSTLAPRTSPFSLIDAEVRRGLPPEVEDAYPLSMLQAGMFFHGDFDGSTAYHDIFSYQVRTRYDHGRLVEALRELMAAHPVLRTSFHLTGFREPLQWVHREVEPVVSEEDLTALGSAQQDAAVRAWFEAEKQRGFTLEQAPLIRVRLFRRGEAHFEIGLSFHHALLDGWSFTRLLSELLSRYQAKVTGARAELPAPSPVSYRDYIQLEREALASPESRGFWGRYLEGASFIHIPRSPVPPTSGARRSFWRTVALGESLSSELHRQAAAWGLPLKSLLLAAHGRVLGLLAGQQDIVTGIITNGRLEATRGEDVLGLHLNTVPLRLRLDAVSWKGLAAEAFEAEQQLMPHRRFPLAQIQRVLGGQPLFETAFNFLNFHQLSEDLGGFAGLEVSEGLNFTETHFTLAATFAMNPRTRGLDLALEGASTELTEAQVDRFARYYVRCLEELVSQPEARHARAVLLPEAERHQLVVEWNQTEAPLPEPTLVHRDIEAQAERTPDAIAVSFEGTHLTFRQLNQRANQLAHALRARGVGPESRVGLCMERSLELVVAILGVLKAGGAYVPFDPQYPAERLRYMFADAGAALLLTQEHLKPRLPAAGAGAIALDTDWPTIARESPENPRVSLSGDSLAYVIYTSGSTGTPKGAMNTHAGLYNRLRWMQDAYRLTPADRVLQKTPFSFDVSVWEFLWPLMTGARLVVARPGGHQDPAYLVQLIQREQVTTLHFVPSMLHFFLQEPGSERCDSIQRLLCSGEALSLELQRKCAARLSCELHNLYGPTEAAIDVTAWHCAPDHGLSTIPIGKPIDNIRIHLLDAMLNPVPVGVPGELYIGGIGLARGYLARPELTASAFVPDPLATRPGERLYRTGDLARYLPGGEIEYLGRIDHQVKVRGFRIELGEIESALAAFPGVREAVVLAREDVPGDKRLVAYLVGDVSLTEQLDALRSALRERLPDYMVPSAFIRLESLPVTPNGKLDRRALPAPEQQRVPRAARVAPRTEWETWLVELWSRLLQAPELGVEDDFFEVGGNSLLALQMIATLREERGCQLPVGAILEAPTIAALARRLEQGAEGHRPSPLVRLQADGVRPPLFLVHPVGGGVSCYAALTRHLGPAQPVHAFQAPELETSGESQVELSERAARYREVLEQAWPEGPVLLGGWSFGGLVAYEMARQLEEKGRQVAMVALMDSAVLSHLTPEQLDEEALFRYFAVDLLGPGIEQLSEEAAHLKALPGEERLAYLRERAIALGQLSPALSLEQLERIHQVFTSNLKAGTRYEPRGYRRNVVLLQAAGASAEQKARQLEGWRQATQGALKVIGVSGEHYTLLESPHVEPLVQALAAELERALEAVRQQAAGEARSR